jgi:transposase-like protein
MSLSETKSNGIDVRTEGPGPHAFGAADYRSWIEDEIRGAVKAVLEEILETEIAAHLGATPGERTESRSGYRNGSYTRGLVTRVGEVELNVPRDRAGSFRPGVFGRYRRMESPLEEALLRAYLEGVSTRRVGDIAEALSGEGLSASSVSRLNGRLSERLQAWRERPLSGAYPYLYLDGISLAVRWGGASERVSVLVAIGVSEEGFREVLCCTAGFRESEESWRSLLRSLTQRGLQGVRLLVSDAGAGLKAAMADFLPGATWQRCSVHVMRNVLDKVPQSRRAEVAAALKTIWHQESAEEARHKAERVKEQFRKSLPAAMRTLEGALEDSLTFYRFPREHWKMLRTNNPLERLMKEIRRRTKVAEQFPSEESALLLVTARLKRIHESWAERRYLDMQPLYEMEQSQSTQASAA